MTLIVVTASLRNRAPTIGFNNIFDFDNFEKSYNFIVFQT